MLQKCFFDGISRNTFWTSKKNRRVLNVKFNTNLNFALICNNFFGVCEINPTDNVNLSAWGVWAHSCLPNDFRDFLYKFYFNKLGINARTVHFGGASSACTFCEITAAGMAPLHNESFMHLFFYCPPVKFLQEQIQAILFDFLVIPDPALFWFGVAVPNKITFYIIAMVQFMIWKCKLRKTIPKANWCLGEAIFLLDSVISTNSSLEYELFHTNHNLYRIWRGLRATRW
jgi:hypothetical protein